MSQSLAAVYLDVVFSTRHREALLTDNILRAETHAYLGAVSRELDCPPEIIGGTSDHAHALVRFGRTITIADYVKEAKRVTTSWLRTRAPELHDFHWQSGYGAFSVSSSNLPKLVEYIRNQEEHHRKRSFQDEFRALLKNHRIEFDERYIWD
jgi:putative transposase